MAVYGVEVTGKTLDVLKWPNKKEAQSAGNSWLLVETEKELAESSVSTKYLADLWNLHNPSETVKRFSDRELGAEKVFALFGKIAITPLEFSQPKATEEESEMAKAAAATKKSAKAPAKAGARKGNAGNLVRRASKFAEKKLFPSAEAKKQNPHREASIGGKSIKIIIDNPGIAYEDFVKKGGHPGYLNHQVGKGFVTVK